MAVVTRPRESKGTLETMANTYAVENGILYDYYPIKLGDRRGDFVTIVKLPPVMQEGYVTYQRKLYKVTLRDFFRSRVNVGQSAYTTNSNDSGVASTSTADFEPTPNVDSATASDHESRVDSTFGVQINQAANLAFEEQVRALLYLDDPEEEWQFEASAQSGLVDASSPV